MKKRALIFIMTDMAKCIKATIVTLVCAAALILSLAGCKTLFTSEGRYYREARYLAGSGEYAGALESLGRALLIDPSYEKALVLLIEVYPEAVAWYERELEELRGRSDIPSLDRKAETCAALVSIHATVQALPELRHPETGAPIRLYPRDYRAELEAARTEAAEGHYGEGIRLAARDSREDAKQASKEFLKVLEYRPGYRDAAERESAARLRAAQNLAVLPFTHDFSAVFESGVGREIRERLIASLTGDQVAMEYTNLVDQAVLKEALRSQREALSSLYDESAAVKVGRLVQANLVLSGKVEHLRRSEPDPETRVYEREAEVPATAEDLGREPLEGETVTVGATVTCRRYSSSAGFRTVYTLNDLETGTIILSDTFSLEAGDELYRADYEGDPRALTAGDLEMIRDSRRRIKDPDTLLRTLAEEAGEEIARALRDYLR